MKGFPGIRISGWGRLLAVAVSLAGLWWISRKIDLTALGLVLGMARLKWFAAGFLLFGVCSGFATWRWHLLLRSGGLAVHSAATFRLLIIGHFFNALLFGPAGGDFAKTALYARWHRFPFPDVLAISFFDRTLGGAGNVVFLLLSIGVAWFAGLFAGIAGRVSLGPVLGGLGLLVIFLGSCIYARHCFPKDSPIVRTLDGYVAMAGHLARRPRLAFTALIVSVLVHFTYSGVLGLALRSVSAQPFSWIRVFWAFPLISLAASIPVSVAGAGIREGASLVLLGFCGISATDAVAASLLSLLIYVIWAFIGAFIWWREERLLKVAGERPVPQTISVVIPTWNEAGTLPSTLERLRRIPEISEILIADAESQDATRQIAKENGCSVMMSSRGRGQQLRVAAQAATGDVVLMLHADTWLAPECGRALINALRDSTVVAGGFWKRFQPRNWWMSGSRFRCWIRLTFFGRVMGDQALFVRREVLEKAGGVPAVPLMEEFELCQRLRRHGRLALAPATVFTSTRRFAKLGVARTYLRMWKVTALYYLGTPLQKLQAIYERE